MSFIKNGFPNIIPNELLVKKTETSKHKEFSYKKIIPIGDIISQLGKNDPFLSLEKIQESKDTYGSDVPIKKLLRHINIIKKSTKKKSK